MLGFFAPCSGVPSGQQAMPRAGQFVPRLASQVICLTFNSGQVLSRMPGLVQYTHVGSVLLKLMSELLQVLLVLL